MNFHMTYSGRAGCFYARNLLKLKLTTILILATIMQVSATGYAQLTLNEKSVTLEYLLKKIRKQSGYDFFYGNIVFKNATPVSINVKNATVDDVLKIAFKNQPFSYSLNEKTIVVKNIAEELNDDIVRLPVDFLVKGKVLDHNGKPITGATITIKLGKVSKQVFTDAKGDFQIAVPEGVETLTVSYVGYKTQQINIKTNRNLSIKMVPATTDLEDVTVNTGIFKKSIESFTGASTTITAKELTEFGNRNLITTIRNVDPSFSIVESNANGSNPNKLPEISIRGNSSIPNVGQLTDEARAELNAPLIILDGFQSTLQKLYDMNENEVASITILKDASATAMYGSRGANGVIVITTKAPKAGKLRITLRSDLNWEAPDLSAYSLLKAADKLELERLVGYYDLAYVNQKSYYNFILNEINSGVETDWMALPLQNGVGQRHFLKIEGGDNAFRYSASGQLNDISGVMKKSSRRTFNGNIVLSYSLKNLRFTNNLQIQQTNSQESPYGTFSDYVKQNPYWRPFDSNGNVIKLLGDPGDDSYNYNWSPLPTNPLYNATLNTFDKTTNNQLINNSMVEWTVLPSLLLRAQFGLTKTLQQHDAFRPADHTAFADYSGDDFLRRGDYNYGITNGSGYDGSLNLSYSKQLGLKHLITAGADYNIRQNQSSNSAFLAEGFTNANLDIISMALQYAKNSKPTGSESLVRAIGITGNLNYSYDNRYFIDASFRMDGSSQFGSSKRFAPFWSAGAGWNLHNEKFFKNNSYINRLKLRGSMGSTGAQNFSAYQALSTYQYYTDQRYYNWLGAYLLAIGNENLKWQQTLKYNIGTDIELLNRRLRITADYYTETTKDLISTVNLAPSNGFATYVDNIGKLENKGYEIKATGFIISNPKAFTWSITGALLHNKNKIVETSKALKDAQAATLAGTGDPGTLYIEGYSSNTIWVVPSLGIDPSNGKEVFLGKNGLATYTWKASDVVAAGSRDPKFWGNFSSMLRYKDFAINASFRYTYGGQQYNNTLVDRVETTSYKYNVDSRVFYSRWQKPGDVTAFKAIQLRTATYKSSRFVQDENTLVLQNVNFQYFINNKNWLKKVRMESLNVTLNVAEPFYLSSIRRERGTSYPFSRQFSLSLNVTF